MKQPGDVQALSTSGSVPTVTEWHSVDPSDVGSMLGVDVNIGLSTSDAATRFESVGPNEIGGADQPSVLGIAAQQFTSVLTVLLLVAAAASGFLLGEWIDAAAISAILALNATIGFVQELRAAGPVEWAWALGLAAVGFLGARIARRLAPN